MTLYEDWLTYGVSTSRRNDVFEGGPWCEGEGIFYELEVAITPEAYVSSGGQWYDSIKQPFCESIA